MVSAEDIDSRHPSSTVSKNISLIRQLLSMIHFCAAGDADATSDAQQLSRLPETFGSRGESGTRSGGGIFEAKGYTLFRMTGTFCTRSIG